MENSSSIEKYPNKKVDINKNINNNKKFNLICCIICFVISLILIIFIILFLVFIGHPILEDEEKDKNKKISELDFLKAKYNTLLKLNNVKYPSNKQNYIYKDEYLSSFNNFTYLFFKKLNFSDFCPITLYNVLINVFMGISDEGLSKTLNNILGLNETERILFYSQIIQNNYFKDSDSEIKMSNGGFYNSDIAKENKSYVDKLTETYTECYKLSYKKDFNYILDWVDKSVNEKNFLKKDIFKDLGNTSLLLFSTLYYRQKWEYKFLDSKMYKGPFYINNEKSKEVMFLNHEYYARYIYDYEEYYSFNDFYSNEYKINYLVPKSKNNNILEIIKDKNFLYENETYKEDYINIDLSVPKFKSNINLDIVPILKDLGLEKLFDKNYSTFDNPFIIEKDLNYYLNQVYQKNSIELNEDGTTIKSVSFVLSGVYANSAQEKSIEIKLDKPFIYIIKDKNNLPIFIGYIDDPNY